MVFSPACWINQCRRTLSSRHPADPARGALGYDTAWIAQHHFHENEGGLPSPLLFLASVAAQTSRIRLGTAIITLPMENALRVAEDAAVLDLLSQQRLELGLGSGGTHTSFLPFGLTFDERAAAFNTGLNTLLQAWAVMPWAMTTTASTRPHHSWQNASGRRPSPWRCHPRRRSRAWPDAVAHAAAARRKPSSAAG
ncbi:hypothetical protein ERHA55_51710 (plasmid) [Erwinia rhapontici]|nr:hypothetical protein ERHA55_51710 [Erwinia rhapontici]